MKNAKAFHEYEMLDGYVAGIQLTGKEVKAVRENKLSFVDSYCFIEDDEMYINKLHVSINDGKDEEFTRRRKLLLNRKEIVKIDKQIKEKGLTVVPTSIFINETGLIKVGIYVARGKKLFNKKVTQKEKDLKREERYE